LAQSLVQTRLTRCRCYRTQHLLSEIKIYCSVCCRHYIRL